MFERQSPLLNFFELRRQIIDLVVLSKVRLPADLRKILRINNLRAKYSDIRS